jgi:hypothetical protein
MKAERLVYILTVLCVFLMAANIGLLGETEFWGGSTHHKFADITESSGEGLVTVYDSGDAAGAALVGSDHSLTLYAANGTTKNFHLKGEAYAMDIGNAGLSADPTINFLVSGTGGSISYDEDDDEFDFSHDVIIHDGDGSATLYFDDAGNDDIWLTWVPGGPELYLGGEGGVGFVTKGKIAAGGNVVSGDAQSFCSYQENCGINGTHAVVVKGSGGSNCTLNFDDGLLYSENCP